MEDSGVRTSQHRYGGAVLFGDSLGDFVSGCAGAAAEFVQGIVEIEADPSFGREDGPEPLDVIVPAAETERDGLLLDVILLGVGEETVRFLI